MVWIEDFLSASALLLYRTSDTEYMTARATARRYNKIAFHRLSGIPVPLFGDILHLSCFA